MTISKGLLIVSIICFGFAAFGFNPGALQIVPLGLAFFAAAHL